MAKSGTFPEFIRRRRNQLNLSLQALADASGLSKSYLHFLEQGQRENPTVEKLRLLADGLKVPVETLDRLARGLPDEPELSRSAQVNQLADRIARLPASAQVDVLTMVDALLTTREQSPPAQPEPKGRQGAGTGKTQSARK